MHVTRTQGPIACPFFSVVRFLLIAGVSCAAVRAFGGEVTLKNGFVIEGSPRRVQALSLEAVRQKTVEPSYPFVVVENGYQWIFISKNQAAKIEERDELSRFETFKLPQRRQGVKHAVGRLVATTPFDASGRRTHTVETAQGTRQIVVGVKRIGPKYLSITGINYEWDYGVATLSVPPAQLDAMIRKVNDPKNPDHRFAIARFYLQAGMYDESGKELESIARDFPELESRVTEARKELQNLEHRLIVQELTRLKATGQHEQAHFYALGVPQNEASATILHDVRALLHDYDVGRDRIAKMHALLGELQEKVDDARLASALVPLRAALESQLSLESLDRLQAFFNLASDTTLRPSEKLALAYSGWVVGSASAVTDLGLAVRMWQAQHAILQYLHAETPRDRKDRLEEITALDGIGPDTVLKLLRNLLPAIETNGVSPGVPATIQVPAGGGEAVSYTVLVPPEYDWRHSYPMIVTLRPPEHSAKSMLDWWGGTATNAGMSLRRGYIVIAPEYGPANAVKYNYSVSAHDAVLRSIVDARKRFNIDSDRIFLSGHGMGGDAAFDIGMSHPDVFAGVIPINGIAANSCKWYWQNAGHTSWYVINGELDRDAFSANVPILTRMMKGGQDVLAVEFVERGLESYHEEITRIFDWMEQVRRRKPPRDFSMKVLRPSENRFYWLRADGLPPSVVEPTFLAGESRGTVQPMDLQGRIVPSGTAIYLRSGAKHHTIWLTPELATFGKRMTIHGRTQKIYFVPQPSIEAMLEDYDLRADRQLIYTARVDVD